MANLIETVINAGAVNATNDASLYIVASNNNDWGLRINKYNNSATEYGARIEVGSSAGYALQILGNGSESLRIYGSGAITTQSSVDINSGLYLRNSLYVLNAAGNGWQETIVRNSGSPYFANNVDGGTFLASNGAENNNWLFQENARGWGLYYFNRGTESGQTIGTYSTVGAETFFIGQNAGITMPSGWTGYNASSKIAAMISNYNGYIYSASTVFAATSLRSPIFYDSDNDNYYLNPASTSNINNLTVAGSLSEGGYTAYPERVYTINFSAQSTAVFYPVVLDASPGEGTPGVWHHRFSVEMPSQGSGVNFNNHTLVAEVRGQGWSDQQLFYRAFHTYYDTSERSILGIWRGTQAWYGVVVYLRGGQTYYVRTNSRSVTGYTSAVTLNSSATFALKDYTNADVSGTSANISEMLNLFNTAAGFYHSNIIIAPSMYAARFYDNDNSTYYLDPASTSNLNGLTVAGTITGSITGNAGTVTVTAGATNGAWYPIVWHDGNTLKSTSNVRIWAQNGYIESAYLQTTDDVSTSNISHIVAKFGDNYHRSATAAKVAGFISGQNMNIVGNATTVTNGVYTNANNTFTANNTFSNSTIIQGNYYRRYVGAASPSANFGNFKQYLRLWAASGSGTNLFTLRITINGDWNYSPINGILQATYSLYLPGDGTISTTRDFRINQVAGFAGSNLRIGDAVIENGYVSIPFWCINTNPVQITIEQWGGTAVLGTVTTAVSESLPAFIPTAIQGGLSTNDNIIFPNTSNVGLSTADGTALLRLDDTYGNIYLLNSAGGFYVDATSHNFRNTSASNLMVINSSGDVTATRYLVGTYVNTSDNVPTSENITYVMAKFGDNYHRSASAAKVAGFISGQSMNINGSSTSCTGNAATATNSTQLGGVAAANYVRNDVDGTDSTDLFRLKTFTKSLTVTTSWLDTGISGTDLATGVYAISLFVDNYSVGGGHYAETYAGIMSWYSGGTNSTDYDEITLHKSGHAPNTRYINLRTLRQGTPNPLKLQIISSVTTSGAVNYVFKFRRLI